MSSTREDKTRTQLGHDAAQWLRANVREFDGLPEPGNEWLAGDIELAQQYLPQLRSQGIIKRVGIGKEQRRLYQTTKKGHDAIQTFLSDREANDRLLPCDDPTCPGSGFVTTSDGLECKYCGETHDKAEVRGDE